LGIDHAVCVCLITHVDQRSSVTAKKHTMLSRCRGTARRSESADIFSTAAQLCEKLHLKRFSMGEWPWRSHYNIWY